MSKWTKEEETAFRGAPHRWTYNERLMLDEINELRVEAETLKKRNAELEAQLKTEQEGRMNFLLQCGPEVYAADD